MVIALFIFLLILSAFFSGSETALLSLNKFQLKRLKENNASASHRIVTLLSKPRALFFTILTGNTLVNTAASASATLLAIKIFGPGPRGVSIAIPCILSVLLLFGEVIPKTYAYLAAEKFSKYASLPIAIIVKLFTPIRKLLFIITDNMIKKLGFIAPKDTTDITDDELKSLIKIGHREGVVEDDEKEMIYGVFKFKGQCSKDIMTPKINIKAIDFDTPQDKIVADIKDAKHSRLPVFRNSMDNVIGIVYAKDVLFSPNRNLKDLMRGAYIIPESQKIDHLLADLQKRSIQMAIVTDEYGITVGVVTIEDILEEIVGEIVDEYDKEEPLITKLDEKTYLLSGQLHIGDANKRLKLKIKTDEVDTMGGFVSLIMQKIPKEKEEFTYGKHKFKVSKVEKNRVKEIIVTKIQ